MGEEVNRKGQVTIFVIIAVLIVAVILVLVSLGGEDIITPFVGREISPGSFIEDCTEDAVSDVLDVMIPQGGFIQPETYKVYNDINVVYLCLEKGNFRPCVNQHPLLLNEISLELKNNITPVINDCYLDMKDELEKRQNEVDIGDEASMIINGGNFTTAAGDVLNFRFDGTVWKEVGRVNFT